MFESKTVDNRKIADAIRGLILVGTKEYLTVPEACQYLGVSRTTLYHLRTQGCIETISIGARKVLIPKRSIQDYIDQCRSVNPFA